MTESAINAPGSTPTKASPELRELAHVLLDAPEMFQCPIAERLAMACELENVNVFKLLAEVRSDVRTGK